MSRVPVFAVALVAFGCAKTPAQETAAPETSSTEETDTPPTEDTQDTEDTEDTAPPEPDDLCSQEGLTRRDFVVEGAFGSQRRDYAEDFTVPTVDGDWVFSEQFTGCETYVFIADFMPVSPLDDTPMMNMVDDLAELIEKSPVNAQYFFVSYRSDIEDFADEMTTNLAEALSLVSDGDAEHFADRLHVVSVSGGELDAWVQDALFDPTHGFAIDRFQRLRELGSLGDVYKYDTALNNAGQWPWRDNVAYTAHMPQYFNYESDLDDYGADPAWTTTWLLYEDPVWLTGNDDWDVELPAAAEMEQFDTLLVDLSHVCDPASMEWGNCDAWDAVQTLWLCQEDDPTVCDIEVARYITTYHREGRWFADASELLPYLRSGGTRHFVLGGIRGGHYVSLRLLFGNAGKGQVPYAIEPLWTGGNFDANYEANHPPMTLDVPADATSVHLHVMVTGHGMSAGDNCAEFCNHEHYFTIGDSTWSATHPEIWNIEGCLEQIPDGSVPNQYGTWWYARSSWCPGKQVDPWVFDITDAVTPGSPVTIEYTTNEGAVTGGNIELRTYMVSWK